MAIQLVVAVDGADAKGVELERVLYDVNTLEAALEKRDSVEGEWKREGWHRNGFDPVRFIRFEPERSNEWRRAVVVRAPEVREVEHG